MAQRTTAHWVEKIIAEFGIVEQCYLLLGTLAFSYNCLAATLQYMGQRHRARRQPLGRSTTPEEYP
jgi:hypothetical protein